MKVDFLQLDPYAASIGRRLSNLDMWEKKDIVKQFLFLLVYLIMYLHNSTQFLKNSS